MGKIKTFIMTSLLGGVIVILPVVILFAVFEWVFHFITSLIQPLTDLIIAKSDIREIIADFLVLVIILATCFFVGLVVRTKFGGFIFNLIEHRLLKIAPGYTLIKETVLQLLGGKRAPFSAVVLVRIFENDTLATGFVMDEHANGMYTVFVPTAPNPTTGFIYHLKPKYVYQVDVSVEEAMRTIISCGAGSSKLIERSRHKI